MPTINQMSEIVAASMMLVRAVDAAYPEADDEKVKFICNNAISLAVCDEDEREQPSAKSDTENKD